MKSEPKTPLQLRAENMIKEDELLDVAGPQEPAGEENVPPVEEEEQDERKEVFFAFDHVNRTNPCFLTCSDILNNRSDVVWE